MRDLFEMITITQIHLLKKAPELLSAGAFYLRLLRYFAPANPRCGDIITTMTLIMSTRDVVKRMYICPTFVV